MLRRVSCASLVSGIRILPVFVFPLPREPGACQHRGQASAAELPVGGSFGGELLSRRPSQSLGPCSHVVRYVQSSLAVVTFDAAARGALLGNSAMEHCWERSTACRASESVAARPAEEAGVFAPIVVHARGLTDLGWHVAVRQFGDVELLTWRLHCRWTSAEDRPRGWLGQPRAIRHFARGRQGSPLLSATLCRAQASVRRKA